MSVRIHPGSILILVLLVCCPAAPARQWRVGPDQACRTISGALARMTDGDTCVIDEGVYREQIIVRQSHVTLRGQGRVVITGCDEAASMEPCRVNGQAVLKTPVDTPVYDVFCGERCLMPARYPDKTAPMTSNEDWEFAVIDADGTVAFENNAQRTFTNLNDGYYVGLHGSFKARHGKLSSWYSISLPITGLDDRGRIHIDADGASSGYMGNYGRGRGLGYLIGARAVLDAPGEWYADPAGEVLLIPPDGASGPYQLRTRLYGAVITGRGVQLENIRFRAAALRVDGDAVSLKHCTFDHISPFRHTPNDLPANRKGQSLACGWGVPENGTAGVFVRGDYFTAEDCRFQRSWWCGMMIRGSYARVENCLFEDLNWMARRCAGLFSWGRDSRVRYCTFRNLGGAAIEGGNANWVGQYAIANIWEYNYIEDIGKLIVDQGFFYVNHQSGANPRADSIWRYNIGRTSRGPQKGQWTLTSVGYYVDNSSSGYRIHNNIVIDAREAIRYNDTQDGPRAGKDIWFYNNTFYLCDAIGFNSFGNSRKVDAGLHLVNNLSVGRARFDLGRSQSALDWTNNRDGLSASVFKDPDRMDFTPIPADLRFGGVPVDGQSIGYIGAVDPQAGMWRCGADESRLPRP